MQKCRLHAAVLVLLAALLLAASPAPVTAAAAAADEAAPASSGDAALKLMSGDPERLFDATTGTGTQILLPGGKSLDSGEASKLLDGSTKTHYTLSLPSGKGDGKPIELLSVKLQKPEEVVQATLTFDSNAAGSAKDYSGCLTTAYWKDDSGRILDTLPDRAGTPDMRAQRINYWNRKYNGGKAAPSASTFTLYLPGPCREEGLSAAVTRVQLFKAPSLLPFGSKGQIADDHFHPCSFSQVCTPLDEVGTKTEATGVAMGMVFGLQHNLAAGARKFIERLLGRSNSGDASKKAKAMGLDDTPFHYGDKGALDVMDLIGKDSNVDLKALARNLTAWPMFPTSLADWRTLTDYVKHPQLKGRVFPFVSSMRMEEDDVPGMWKWGVCSKDPGSNRTYNEQLIRAFDTYFPKAVFGYQEYNLNKTAVAVNRVPPASMNDQWIKCMQGPMSYISETNRPIGFHSDFKPDPNWPFWSVVKAFPDTIIIWDHGGIAPEVDTKLSAADHIAAMKKFLSSGGKGKRFVDFSWSRGWFLRLNPNALGNVEKDLASGAEKPRDWGNDARLYMQFIKDNQDAIMVGSDQVALDYNHSISIDHEGKISVHRAGYSQSIGYGDSLRQEIGLLYNAMKAAGPGHEIPTDALEKIFYGNAKKLMDGVKQPAPGVGPGRTGLFQPSAKRFLQYLVILQLQDNMRIVGDDAAPKKEDFLPPDLQKVEAATAGRRLRLFQ